jgi:hypothetical protein
LGCHAAAQIAETAVPAPGKAVPLEIFHRKIRRSEGLIVRRAFGAERDSQFAGGSANPKISARLLIFLSSCEKIWVRSTPFRFRQ